MSAAPVATPEAVLTVLEGEPSAMSTTLVTLRLGLSISGSDWLSHNQVVVNDVLHDLLADGKVVRTPAYRSYEWSLP